MLLKMIRFYLLVLALPLLIASCSKKGGGGGTTPPAEENLIIAIDPDPGSTIAKSLGASYDFKLLITSKVPAQGVEGTLVYKKDSDNSTVFSQTLQTSAAQLNLQITGIPLNEVGTVTIELKSKTKATNTASKSFKLIRK